MASLTLSIRFPWWIKLYVFGLLALAYCGVAIDLEAAGGKLSGYATMTAA